MAATTTTFDIPHGTTPLPTNNGSKYGHKESEDVWNHGYANLFTSTNASDFTIKKRDPRAKSQKPIKNSTLGAGIDHVSFLEFEDVETRFRRRLGLGVNPKMNEKEAEKKRFTSTHRQDFNASGFHVNDLIHSGKTAGRPTKPNEDCEPFATLKNNVAAALARSK